MYIYMYYMQPFPCALSVEGYNYLILWVCDYHNFVCFILLFIVGVLEVANIYIVLLPVYKE